MDERVKAKVLKGLEILRRGVEHSVSSVARIWTPSSGPKWHARHDAVISERRFRYLTRFTAEFPCFIRRKKQRRPDQDATSIQPLSRLL